jgi:uncharacterized caspase-like protein
MKIKCICLLIILSKIYAFPSVYAVIVGISSYDNPAMNLHYADKDANSFYKYLRLSNKSSSVDNFTLLTNENATRENITRALSSQFAKATTSDHVIFFFSGHGGDGYFTSYDSGFKSRHLYHYLVRDAFKNCKAKTKLCFADACHSGSIRPKSIDSKMSNRKNFFKEASNNTDERVVFMSSRPNESSQETVILSNGVFTYYLIKSLKGSADVNSDKKITAFELYTYVHNNVRKLTNNKQNPQMFGKFSPNQVLVNYK